MFSHDIKTFSSEKSTIDEKIVQECLMLFTHGVMSLNSNNISYKLYQKTRSHINTLYYLQVHCLQRRNEAEELGVLMQSSWDYSSHVSFTTSSNKNIGMISRSSRHLSWPKTLQMLYNAYVRTIFEDGSVLWSPCQLTEYSSLQAVQNRLIRIDGLRLGFNNRTVPMDGIASQLKLNC